MGLVIGCLSSEGIGAIVRYIVDTIHHVKLCTSTLSFMTYLAASLATDAESATLAERAMRASRKKGDISDTEATDDCAEVNWQSEVLFMQFDSSVPCWDDHADFLNPYRRLVVFFGIAFSENLDATK